MSEDRNWFITERSEALASLILTSRIDLSVRSKNPQDDGVDFVVASLSPYLFTLAGGPCESAWRCA